jgi:hypothetical protein
VPTGETIEPGSSVVSLPEGLSFFTTLTLGSTVSYLIQLFGEESEGTSDIWLEFQDVLLREYMGDYLALPRMFRPGPGIEETALEGDEAGYKSGS